MCKSLPRNLDKSRNLCCEFTPCVTCSRIWLQCVGTRKGMWHTRAPVVAHWDWRLFQRAAEAQRRCTPSSCFWALNSPVKRHTLLHGERKGLRQTLPERRKPVTSIRRCDGWSPSDFSRGFFTRTGQLDSKGDDPKFDQWWGEGWACPSNPEMPEVRDTALKRSRMQSLWNYKREGPESYAS